MGLGNRENTLEVLRRQGADVATLADRVAVLVCAGNKQILTFIDPVDLLPPSDFGVLMENADGSYGLTLRQLLLTTYWEDEDEGTSGKPSATLQGFREAVRGAVAAELAKPGPKRQLIEITFEVAGEPRSKRTAGPASVPPHTRSRAPSSASRTEPEPRRGRASVREGTGSRGRRPACARPSSTRPASATARGIRTPPDAERAMSNMNNDDIGDDTRTAWHPVPKNDGEPNGPTRTAEHTQLEGER